MKSHTIWFLFSSSLFTIAFQGCYSVSQDNREVNLERRVETLEQKVAMLESRKSAPPLSSRMEAGRARMIMMSQIQKMAQMANQYYGQQVSARHGTGTYKGFTLPVSNDPFNVATYSVMSSDTDIVIEGRAIQVDGTISGRVVQQGKAGDWKFAGEFAVPRTVEPRINTDYIRDAESIANEMANISLDVLRYLHLPSYSVKAGYERYTLPPARTSSNTAWFVAEPHDSTLVVEGNSKKYPFILRIVINSQGHVQKKDSIHYAGIMKTSIGNQKTAVDSLRETITNDFKTIAARARQYRSIPSTSGGGGGKYSGYMSAQMASLDGRAEYQLMADPDVILLKAISVAGFGTMSVKVDGNGNLSAWYYTGKLAE